MRPYETMIIFDSEADESAITAVLEKGLELVRSNGGTTGVVNRWGKRTLAYEVRKKREGYYVVAEFTSEPKASAELDRFLVLADEVLRHKIVRMPEKVAGRRRPPGPGASPSAGRSRPAPARSGARAAPAAASELGAEPAPSPTQSDEADVAPAPAAG
ncbi:MAG TPA: 30S ribosomal protein S6 [Acidimicrobiales bacterium]|nr:30S ribosomal protein S6 [Acidimicrobiales bacterium]